MDQRERCLADLRTLSFDIPYLPAEDTTGAHGSREAHQDRRLTPWVDLEINEDLVGEIQQRVTR